MSMTQKHWRVVAILGGLALGFFATAKIAGWIPGGYGTKIYNQGITSGGNYGP